MNRKRRVVTILACWLIAGCSPVQQGKPSTNGDGGTLKQLKISDLKGDPAATVVIHYRRSDGQYKQWGLWLWGDGQEGKLHAFDGRDAYGAYKNVYLKGKKIGFIVRRKERWVKDVGGDRFWSSDMPRHIFLRSSQAPIFTTPGGKRMQKLLAAQLVGDKTIICRVTANAATIKAQQVLLTADDKQLPISGVTADGDTRLVINSAEKIAVDARGNVRIREYSGLVPLLPAPSLLSSARFSYQGDDLGATYSTTATRFRLWAPVAEKVELLFYAKWDSLRPQKTIPMQKSSKGTWVARVAGDLRGRLYNYRVQHGGKAALVVDPWGKAMAGFDSGGKDKVGKNAVVDLAAANPGGWNRDRRIRLKDPRDAVIYEIHVRDFTIDPSSGVPEKLRGSYLGFIRKIPYLKRLGVTHVQLLPVQNFYYGNEFQKQFETAFNGAPGFKGANYNWGYDPHNYFTPEGWYSLDPADPLARIRELKTLIKALHDAGIGVILDVVYNHTARTEIFEPLVPGYFYRRDQDGNLCNGSGCGNDLASRRPMVRKLILDSLAYWVREYHVDGFRFDLLGLTDETTVKLAWQKLHKLHPGIIMHGEGWNVGSYLPVEERYIKAKSQLKKGLGQVAVFNDGIRDAIKSGGLAGMRDNGFATGNRGVKPYLKMSVVGGLVSYLKDPEIKNFTTQKSHILELQKNSRPPTARNYAQFTDDSSDTLNYISCHDNRTLWDKIRNSAVWKNPTRKELERMDRLAQAILFTCQGRVFLHAGAELLRSKPNPHREGKVDHNSYDSGDNVNRIDWTLLQKNASTFSYMQGLIALRRARRAFRLRSAREIISKLTFLNAEGKDPLCVTYRIEDPREAPGWRSMIVIYNGNRKSKRLTIPGLDKNYRVVVDHRQAGLKPVASAHKITGNTVTVPGLSAMVLAK